MNGMALIAPWQLLMVKFRTEVTPLVSCMAKKVELEHLKVVELPSKVTEGALMKTVRDSRKELEEKDKVRGADELSAPESIAEYSPFTSVMIRAEEARKAKRLTKITATHFIRPPRLQSLGNQARLL